jgi:CheY-like chemotaxis protein
MSSAGKRAASLTRQLLAFSRKAILEPKLLDLSVVLNDVGRMLRRIIGEDIELLNEMAPDLGTIRADPSQIEQVLLNLAVNARDAMPQGGKLRIEARNIELDERSAHDYHGAQPGRYVALTVTDTGCGMDTGTLTRIWEPFFTTKGEAGTGLGLATVYGIIRQSGGSVGVQSRLGQGTTFTILLPRVDAPVPAPASSTPGAMPRGSETILVVEDAEGVRNLMCHVLERCGYCVVRASNGTEALQVAAGIKGAYDLLVTDVVMPGMAGPEVAARLGELYPGRKTLFLSGYTDDAVVRHGIQQAEVEFLQKPFGPTALAQKVREVLDR